MEKQQLLEETQKLLAQDLALPHSPGSDEALLHQAVAERVEYLITHRLEYFFRLLYRLDVSEALVREALAPIQSKPAHETIAELIIEREKEKAATRLKYRNRDQINEEDRW